MSSQSTYWRNSGIIPYCSTSSQQSKGVLPVHSALYRKGAVLSVKGVPDELVEFFPPQMVLTDDLFAEVGREVRICPVKDGRWKVATFRVETAGVDVLLSIQYVPAEIV